MPGRLGKSILHASPPKQLPHRGVQLVRVQRSLPVVEVQICTVGRTYSLCCVSTVDMVLQSAATAAAQHQALCYAAGGSQAAVGGGESPDAARVRTLVQRASCRDAVPGTGEAGGCPG